MFRLGRSSSRAAVLALCVLAVMPGCDWLKASDMIKRSSPFLSSLSVSPATVLCGSGNEFSVSFDYDDPQGDISQATVTLQNQAGSGVQTEIFTWPDTLSRSSGSAAFSLSFDCGNTGGLWSVAVEVMDDVGHSSNVLSGEITLNAAG